MTSIEHKKATKYGEKRIINFKSALAFGCMRQQISLILMFVVRLQILE